MVDIVVNDNQVTTVVETATGDVVVETSGSTTVVSTAEESTVIVLDPVVDVVTTQSTDTVTVDQDVVTILTEGTQGPAGASSWCLFKNTISPLETVVVPSGYFLLGTDDFDVQGTLDVEGSMVIV